MEPPLWNSLASAGLIGLSEVSYYNSLVEIHPSIVRDDGSELVIHAMKMRPKYRRLLPED